MVPKHSLLKYFTLTFTRHKSSKFEGSGPPLTNPLHPLPRTYRRVASSSRAASMCSVEPVNCWLATGGVLAPLGPVFAPAEPSPGRQPPSISSHGITENRIRRDPPAADTGTRLATSGRAAGLAGHATAHRPRPRREMQEPIRTCFVNTVFTSNFIDFTLSRNWMNRLPDPLPGAFLPSRDPLHDPPLGG